VINVYYTTARIKHCRLTKITFCHITKLWSQLANRQFARSLTHANASSAAN